MWFIDNIGSIIVGAILVSIVALLIIGNIRNKKKGKSGCGCGCSKCSLNGICHKTEQATEE